ncbi:hypothetical protein Mal33_42060 [Rosistilla oblonga]|uniref:Uncharacterized protein n=1 Tax=Rosistilla oblonga TaxID=2527990 RepID=A0A518IYM5_9BACT|nr:hypothetical protein Mal33_42060 [Rosistilla oblonga]
MFCFVACAVMKRVRGSGRIGRFDAPKWAAVGQPRATPWVFDRAHSRRIYVTFGNVWRDRVRAAPLGLGSFVWRRFPRALPWAGVVPARWALGICGCLLFGGVFPGRCPGLTWGRPDWAWVNGRRVGIVVGANKKPSFFGNEGLSGNSQFCVICVWLSNRLDYIGPNLAIKSAVRLL